MCALLSNNRRAGGEGLQLLRARQDLKMALSQSDEEGTEEDEEAEEQEEDQGDDSHGSSYGETSDDETKQTTPTASGHATKSGDVSVLLLTLVLLYLGMFQHRNLVVQLF